MLNESYIQSRMKILRWWVFENTPYRGDKAEELTQHIFVKYYGKCLN